jgi:Family of unknown function (DUF5946)
MISAAEHEQFNELASWTLSLPTGGFIHQHVVDAWAAQHADENSKPIGVAFALIGLYLHLEKGFTGREVQQAHMRLAQPRGRGPGRKDWPRFALPRQRGSVTVGDVIGTVESERAAAIDRWCQSVWEAWRENHEDVRAWAARDLGPLR